MPILKRSVFHAEAGFLEQLMRISISISVSEDMHSLILARARAGFYGSVSEYIRALVRRDQLEHESRSTELRMRPPRRANDYFTDLEIDPDDLID